MKIMLTVLILILSFAAHVGGEPAENESASAKAAQEPASLYVVYGMNAEDYLPDEKTAQPVAPAAKPAVRKQRSQPVNNVPESFFFIMIPVFVGILLFVVGLFIHDMEREDKIILEEELGSMNPKP